MPRSRRTRKWLGFAFCLVLLVAGVIANQVLRAHAEQTITNSMSAKLGAGADIKTEIVDPVFLASVVQNTLDDATIRLGDFHTQLADKQVNVISAQLDVHDVSPMRQAAQATIGSLDASVTIDWPSLAQLTGLQLNYVGDGRVEASTMVSAAGHSVTAQVTTGLAMQNPDGQLGVIEPRAILGGADVPLSMVAGATQAFQGKLKLPNVGAGFSYSKITLTEQGATLGLHGEHIQLSQLAQR